MKRFSIQPIITLIFTLTITSAIMAQPPRQRPPRGDNAGRAETPRRDRSRSEQENSPLFTALDSNRDGVLSAKEIENAALSLFELDKNSDGKLEQSELQPSRRSESQRPDSQPRGQGRTTRPPRQQERSRSTESLRGPSPSDGQQSIDERLEQRIARFMASDVDGDGTVSKDELPPQLHPRMIQADLNSDGRLDASEVRRHFKKKPESKQPANAPPKPLGQIDPSNLPKDKTAKEPASPKELSGQPLSIRVIEETGALVITGKKEDVDAIANAFETARKELEQKGKNGSDK